MTNSNPTSVRAVVPWRKPRRGGKIVGLLEVLPARIAGPNVRGLAEVIETMFEQPFAFDDSLADIVSAVDRSALEMEVAATALTMLGTGGGGMVGSSLSSKRMIAARRGYQTNAMRSVPTAMGAVTKPATVSLRLWRSNSFDTGCGRERSPGAYGRSPAHAWWP